MGCSSVALQENGDYEPIGTVLSYLLAGSPCVVGNLWNVTDKDCDRFTKALLEDWFKGGESITECIIRAREECKFKYLMGAATVCYGLPAYVNKTDNS
jgi:separase